MKTQTQTINQERGKGTMPVNRITILEVED